ncbi:MAG: dihydroneopterin aldolase [Runella slithyformis]|nr:MAG: dihydroneopterin aldolase [Runella slithyformis]TAF95140.1 MAG: dihydroneopterin aldolase [Runella sp.]TAG20149.1 MAG: dihydroneopterin aldolase [Cytophagales bacterium]TAG39266.1 MAG: dihydroneopterin aldolase [Cytophagia bacterium]TAE99577.1 MAG: dihydroneopterin aldolase [Runella slithyformis]
MGTISLEGLEFFAYHGVYDEEQKIGNKYAIDIIIEADVAEAAQTDRLRDTINYEIIYKITAEVMQRRARLLEHIGYQIIAKIRAAYPNIESVSVGVSKFNPPVGGVCTRAKVVLKG